MSKFLKVMCLLLITQNLLAQAIRSDNNLIEIASLDYQTTPSFGETQIEKYGLSLNFGKRIGQSMLGFGLKLERNQFLFNTLEEPFNIESFEKMYLIRPTVFFRMPMKKNWSFSIIASPSINSNLEQTITTEDFQYNGFVSVSKKWGNKMKNLNLNLGAGYGTLFGEPRFFPLISLRKKVNQHWSYSLGLPVTGISYTMNERNMLSFNVGPEGYFGNNSSTLHTSIEQSYNDTKIQYNSIRLGLEYRYRIQPSWTLVGNLGYVPDGTLKILDNNNNVLNDFDVNSSPFINVSLKYNLERKTEKEPYKG